MTVAVLLTLASALAALQPPAGLTATPGVWRVDLRWTGSADAYEVERADSPGGPWTALAQPFVGLPCHSDYLGAAVGDRWYRVRAVAAGRRDESAWCEPVHAAPSAYDDERLLDEVQAAGVRYFYDYGHPVSGLAREGLRHGRDLCTTGGSGMGLCNLVVGAERGCLTRAAAYERALRCARFLAERADRFHGAWPHWLHGATGRTIPFSRNDDGADLVETAFLVQGLLVLKGYFDQPDEAELRRLCDELWRAVEWDWFAAERGGRKVLLWHWSPRVGWAMNMPVRGFNETQLVYLLAAASPTHPVQADWLPPGARVQGGPMFFTHYSYLGYDPRRLTWGERNAFEECRRLCLEQVRYGAEHHGGLWGLTACRGPDGYRAFEPGPRDNGTLAPTAALSSWPYVPEESRACLRELYQRHGARLWGPFGFYDAFNLRRDWVAHDYLAIDVGPVAPMIENARSGLCWRMFARALPL